jgi:thiamine monophosphate synthase
LFFGPVFETPGKGSPTGPDELRKVCRSLGSFPVLGLGGVDEKNASQVLAAGAAGIAAIRSLNERDSRLAILSAVEDFKPSLG